MIRRIIACGIIVFATPVFGDDVFLQMLDAQIQDLEQERDEKYEKLKECEKTTKNFKIAGAVTLALTSAGVAANVTLAAQRADALNDGGGSGGGKSATPTDNAPQEEKDCKSLASMCDMGIADACSQKC